MNSRDKVRFVVGIVFCCFVGIILSSAEGQVKYISSIEDLQKIGIHPNYPLNGEYELTQDIDASDTINWDEGRGFAPIGNDSNPFTGKFDGKGYKIRKLYIDRPSRDYVGLFGYVGSGGEVRNVGLENVYISGGSRVGGLVGGNSGTVEQCYSTGSVSSSSSSSSSSCAGGLVGSNRGTVTQSYSTGSVSSSSYSCAGGLVGENYGTVEQCYSTGSVSGGGAVGGLVGYNDYGTVEQCYSTGSVSGGGGVGGLVGYNGSGGTVSQCYWDTETSGQATSAGGEGKTTAEMKHQATFVDWDFTYIWGIVENNSYPYLKWQGGPLVVVPDVGGLSQSSAESSITGAGLKVGMVSQQCDNNVSVGNVISQKPTAGTQVSPGSAVDIVVSSGPCSEGVEEGTPEGVEEGTPEGVEEGTPEGVEEGTLEGVVEGAPEGTKEGAVEGEGRGGEETKKGCGCLGSKSLGGDRLWKYILDFVLVGMLVVVMSGTRRMER